MINVIGHRCYIQVKKLRKKTPGKNLFGINIRTITAFGEMRKRPSGIEIFYGIQARNQEFFRREFCSN